LPQCTDRSRRHAGVDQTPDTYVALSDWEIDGPPAWARRPLAWVACLIDALPLTIASLAFFQWRVGAASLFLGVGLYLLIFALLAMALRPWRSGAPSERAPASCDPLGPVAQKPLS
jgi:hypothetical protein